MARLQQQYKQNGFYGVGIVHAVKEENIGTLWRSAYILGASFIFTIGHRYKKQGSDVVNAWSKIPLYHYEDFAALKMNIPHDTRIIGIEIDDKADDLTSYEHPQRAIYLLGNEQIGLPPDILDNCHALIQLPGKFSLNVSVAGSLVMYDRISKIHHQLPD